MKSSTAEWLAKAEEDFAVGTSLCRRKRIPANIVCFHCQQAAEKYLKGLFEEHRVRHPRTHDLEELMKLATPNWPSLGLLADDFRYLTGFAVKYRYPGTDATPRQARAAVSAAKRVRAAIRPLLK